MAKLLPALNLTFGEEGVWSDGKGKNANDAGGRTWKGIAENMHPNWKGWEIINLHLKDKDFPKSLQTNVELQNLVLSFYAHDFWNVMKGDEIESQEIANNLFDTCVNFGVSSGIKKMQRTLKVTVSGTMDKTTLDKLNQIT